MSAEQSGLLDGALAPALNPKLFGHEAAEAFLAQSYRSGKIHHAILIEGPEGIGKATLAFRFAHHVLTHSDPATAPEHMSDPDPSSSVGRQIASGASHNLLHLTRPVDEKTAKVKQAITVDEVRRAGHFFAQTSGTGNWRIVIIDPADDLNRNAANAILKALEEPPKRALFLVLSHAPGKLLPTIRSRCLPLKLSPLDATAMGRALGNLGLAPAGDDPDGILALSKGSVAQALKLLNYGGADIIAAFRAVLLADGADARREMHRLADALSARDTEVIFNFFKDHLGDYLIDRARQSAAAGDLFGADHFARLSVSIGERMAVSAAYNLDRKQTLLEVLSEVAR